MTTPDQNLKIRNATLSDDLKNYISFIKLNSFTSNLVRGLINILFTQLEKLSMTFKGYGKMLYPY